MDAIDAAREGARDGVAVGISSVPAVASDRPGREKTGADGSDAVGRLEEGEGAAARATVELRGG